MKSWIVHGGALYFKISFKRGKAGEAVWLNLMKKAPPTTLLHYLLPLQLQPWWPTSFSRDFLDKLSWKRHHKSSRNMSASIKPSSPIFSLTATELWRSMSTPKRGLWIAKMKKNEGFHVCPHRDILSHKIGLFWPPSSSLVPSFVVWFGAQPAFFIFSKVARILWEPHHGMMEASGGAEFFPLYCPPFREKWVSWKVRWTKRGFFIVICLPNIHSQPSEPWIGFVPGGPTLALFWWKTQLLSFQGTQMGSFDKNWATEPWIGFDPGGANIGIVLMKNWATEYWAFKGPKWDVLIKTEQLSFPGDSNWIVWTKLRYWEVR